MDNDYTIEELGQLAFEAYSKATGGLTYDKKPIPQWAELPDHVRRAWMAAAQAVREAITGEVPDSPAY